jgi:hypothetical protein
MAKTLKTPEKTLRNSWAMEDYFRRSFFVRNFASEISQERVSINTQTTDEVKTLFIIIKR